MMILDSLKISLQRRTVQWNENPILSCLTALHSTNYHMGQNENLITLKLICENRLLHNKKNVYCNISVFTAC